MARSVDWLLRYRNGQKIIGFRNIDSEQFQGCTELLVSELQGSTKGGAEHERRWESEKKEGKY
jgi:hypothetical protein